MKTLKLNSSIFEVESMNATLKVEIFAGTKFHGYKLSRTAKVQIVFGRD